MNVDRISNLPWGVLECILLHLPLKEAVRTSVLSSKWRHKWTNLSQYVIDDKLLSSSVLDKVARWNQIMKILHQVELNHKGRIQKFKLSAYCRPDHSILVDWIAFLSGNAVKEFILQRFDSPIRFRFPFDRFKCPRLCHLELFGCIIKLPAFEGFSFLTILQLNQVCIDTETLELLLLKCPVLERLTLLEFDNPILLKIQNTKLRYLKIVAAVADIRLRNNPFLADVEIRLRIPPIPNVWQKDNNVVRIIGCLQGIKRLALSSWSLVFLANGDVPEKLPSLLQNLTVLELSEVTVDNLKHAMVSLCLIKSAPNLEELFISVSRPFGSSKHVVDFLKEKCLLGLHFKRLKVVKIRGIWEMAHAWHFIKFILANSPVLETMTIVCYRKERFTEAQLQQLERASEHVKILSLTSAA
ncbi:F-box domain containing protein [Trema orientale]|uniref:F-box domain containing protein n=1 Tax=Trema orientale TaxID=63057 RepID=A0A2P5BAN4_TREOI|nr:F-box domain containing protein [Trema orientale]